jgi:AAA+ superfamily predicted ATPase
MTDSERLGQLIAAGEACISITTLEEQSALDAIRHVALDLKRPLWLWSAGVGLRDGLIAESPYIMETETATGGLYYILEKMAAGDIFVTLDVGEYVKDGVPKRLLRDIIRRAGGKGCTVFTIDGSHVLPEEIRSLSRSFELSYPDRDELVEIVKMTIRNLHEKKPVEVGITKRGMDAIVRNLRGLSRNQAIRVITEAVSEHSRFVDEDVNEVLAGKRRMIGQDGLLEYIRTPLTLESIGGMKNLKRWLASRRDVFSQKAKDFGLAPPRGVLMLGVQGSGKSLCAKAIATAWQQPLLRLDPGVLYNSYIGESESNLRKALKQTAMMSPVVLWIDEIEKGFASAASQSTDGGLSKRMFGTLLTWMQEHTEPVFLVATANDIEAMPPELLRKGRFDEVFFVDLPAKETRAEIFAIHLRRRHKDGKCFDLQRLAEAADGFSGAEIEQVVVSALHEAFAANTEATTEMILREIAATRPLSVMMAEKVLELREWAKTRCVMAD